MPYQNLTLLMRQHSSSNFVLGNVSYPVSSPSPSCKSLLVMLTDFHGQNKILLLNTACISAQGEKLLNCQHVGVFWFIFFSPPVSISGSCATYCIRWVSVWNAVKIPVLHPWRLSYRPLIKYLNIRQLPRMLYSRGGLELVFIVKNKIEYIIYYKFHTPPCPVQRQQYCLFCVA